MALTVAILAEPQYVFAKNEEDSAVNGIKSSLSDSSFAVTQKNLAVEELAIAITGDETVLDVGSGARAVSLESDSVVRYGRVSDYLEQMGEYTLYSLGLSAGDYLQARLTQPNDVAIDYDLVLYDSELSILKVSDYVTCLNGAVALEESIGYLATMDEQLYIGIFSALGGSTTESYTLDFSVMTNFSDDREPNENAREAESLNLENSVVSVSRRLNTAIDNDWYSFTVKDGTAYDKIRFEVTSDSTVNSAKFEVYQNILTNNYAMQRVCYGTGGEIKLSPGTYFLRVLSTHTSGNFNEDDTFGYTLSVAQVSKVTGLEITHYDGYHGADNVDYPEGKFYRIDDHNPNIIRITGIAYNTDSVGNKIAAANVAVTASVKNEQLEDIGRKDLATTYGSAVSRSDGGFFTITVYMNPAIGGLQCATLMSTHYYDLMEVKVSVKYDDSISTEGNFYLLKNSVLY